MWAKYAADRQLAKPAGVLFVCAVFSFFLVGSLFFTLLLHHNGTVVVS